MISYFGFKFDLKSTYDLTVRMFTKYSSGEIQPSIHTHLKHQFLRASSDDFTKNALHNKIKKIEFELTYKNIRWDMH